MNLRVQINNLLNNKRVFRAATAISSSPARTIEGISYYYRKRRATPRDGRFPALILTLIEAPAILPFVGKVWLMVRTAFTPLELVRSSSRWQRLAAIKKKSGHGRPHRQRAAVPDRLWRSHLYLNAWLQVVYFVMSIHGWYEWLTAARIRPS